jgi:hypothetical protein
MMIMTPNMIPLYAAAFVTISMLALFARHNRKSGWRKLRPSVDKALDRFYADLGVPAEPQAPAVPAVVAEDALGFSRQLLDLRQALGNSAPVKPARELVHK